MGTPLTPEQVEEVATVRALLRSGDAQRMREAAGISRAELAALIGCDESATARWETAQRVPRLPVSLRLAAAYAQCANVVEALP